MKKLSIEKLSLLGLVLTAASAVTAAMLPSNETSGNSKVFAPDGTITTSSTPADGLGQFTCAPRNSTQPFNCDRSFFSGTTNEFINTEEFTTSIVF